MASSSSLAPGFTAGGLSFSGVTGTAIVLGCGPGWARDLEAARAVAPAASIIAVNGAAFLEPADHLASMDPACLREGLEAQRRRFDRSPRRHAAWPAMGLRVDVLKRTGAVPIEFENDADFYWLGCLCGASSGWAAARIARGMGFERIILAGVPLATVGYADFPGANWTFRASGWASGDAGGHIGRFQDRLREYVARGEGAGVRSMSGFTAELLGRPD